MLKTSLLPVDLPNIFLSAIEENRRPYDGLLHCSSNITKPLRFTQLESVGAPSIVRPIVQDIRMAHGTLWHEWFHSVLEKAGVNFKYEVNLDAYLPTGWGGTADWLFWHPEYKAWSLADLKTTKGEAMFFVAKDGAKTDHIYQLSAYWHALADMGIPLVKGFSIMYWPMNDTRDTVEINPVVHECDPIERDDLHSIMEAIRREVEVYQAYFAETGDYLNPALADMPEREQKYYWNKDQQGFDVKLVPVWYEQFCDFDEELCPRSKTEKIGQWIAPGDYVPRKGYEDIEPSVEPSMAEYRKRELI